MKKALNKRIFAFITLIFVAICSIMPFTLRNNSVYADEIDTNFITPPTTFSFTSPNYFLPFSSYRGVAGNTWDNLLIDYSFSLIESDITSGYFEFTPILYITYYDKDTNVANTHELINSFNFTIKFYNNSGLLLNTQTFSNSSYLGFDVINNTTYSIETTLNTTQLGSFTFITNINNSLFNDELVYGYRVYSESVYTGDMLYWSNNFEYLLLNGSINVGFIASNKEFLFNDNTTFFANSNIGYQQGFDDGYSEGFDDGEDYANQTAKDRYYQQGYNEGLEEGKSQGFNQGVASANKYSFLGLLGAVVDAPVQALTGLLNFEILGFNMFNLFKGLITLSIILFVVKLIL